MKRKMKCTADDYTENDLPLTRKDVFCECYKEHFRLIFNTGLLCLAFLIPVIIVSFMRDMYVISAVGQLKEQTVEKVSAMVYQADAVYGLFQILAQTLFAVLFAGVVQFLRQLLWNEPIFFGDDLKRGFKSNSLRYGITVFVLSVNKLPYKRFYSIDNKLYFKRYICCYNFTCHYMVSVAKYLL